MGEVRLGAAASHRPHGPRAVTVEATLARDPFPRETAMEVRRDDSRPARRRRLRPTVKLYPGPGRWRVNNWGPGSDRPSTGTNAPDHDAGPRWDDLRDAVPGTDAQYRRLIGAEYPPSASPPTDPRILAVALEVCPGCRSGRVLPEIV